MCGIAIVKEKKRKKIYENGILYREFLKGTKMIE